jgi:hypothetical protein
MAVWIAVVAIIRIIASATIIRIKMRQNLLNITINIMLDNVNASNNI